MKGPISGKSYRVAKKTRNPPRPKSQEKYHDSISDTSQRGDWDLPQTGRKECKTKIVYNAKNLQQKMVVCSRHTREQVLKKSKEYLDIITGRRKLTMKVKLDIIRRTLENFDNFYNRGFLTYRKSVAEAKDFAALEWQGRGSVMRDFLGREYIDCLGGYGIYNMGMCHPKIVEAVHAQVSRMPLSSQELLDPLRGALAELLGELAPGDLQECFFINNGTDAIEGAMKLARLYTGKSGFISTVGGFHGKSMGSLSLMGKAEYRKPFSPLLSNIHFVPFGNADELELELKKLQDVGAEIAAFVVEPVQGEAGARVPPDDYFPRVREICNKYNVLLIADEVQTGMGRTGKVFAVEHWGIVPDILCLGKSLGGGVMPLSAFMKRFWASTMIKFAAMSLVKIYLTRISVSGLMRPLST